MVLRKQVFKDFYWVVGHRSIADKSCAHGAKGPGFKKRVEARMYINKMYVLFNQSNKALIGANL